MPRKTRKRNLSTDTRQGLAQRKRVQSENPHQKSQRLLDQQQRQSTLRQNKTPQQAAFLHPTDDKHRLAKSSVHIRMERKRRSEESQCNNEAVPLKQIQYADPSVEVGLTNPDDDALHFQNHADGQSSTSSANTINLVLDSSGSFFIEDTGVGGTSNTINLFFDSSSGNIDVADPVADGLTFEVLHSDDSVIESNCFEYDGNDLQRDSDSDVQTLSSGSSSSEKLIASTATVKESKDIVTNQDDTYTCFHCYSTFSSNLALKIHNKIGSRQNILKPKTSFDCPECEENFSNEDSQVSHFMLNHGENQVFKCETCSKCFLGLSVVKKHMNEHKRNFTNAPVCGYCLIAFPGDDQLLEHAKLHPMCAKYSCSVNNCEAKFHSLNKCVVHRRIHENIPCQICREVFFCDNDLIQHTAIIHADDMNIYECSICGKKTDGKADMKEHLKTHVYNCHYIYPCNICFLTFPHSCNLRTHLKSHATFESVPGLDCSICDMTFTSIAELTKHKKKHQEISLKCEQCSLVLSDETGLRNHMALQHRLVRIKCGICNMKKSLDGIHAHMIKHGSHDAFTCQMCYTSFPFSNLLHQHELIHQNPSLIFNPNNQDRSNSLNNQEGTDDPAPFFRDTNGQAVGLYDNEDEFVREVFEKRRKGTDITKSNDTARRASSVGNITDAHSLFISSIVQDEMASHVKIQAGMNTKPEKSSFSSLKTASPEIATSDYHTSTCLASSSQDINSTAIAVACDSESRSDSISLISDDEDSGTGIYTCSICSKMYMDKSDFTLHKSWHARKKASSGPIQINN